MNSSKLLLLSLVASACSPVKPERAIVDTLPKGRETPIFVTAARQKDGIKQALRNVGFHIVDQMNDDSRLMRVTIGIDQASKACGTLNNVRFQLRFEERNVAEVNGKGWTGSCQPNILNELSREMWQQLSGLPGN